MEKKTSDGSLIDEFDLLINQCAEAFSQDQAWKTGRELAFGLSTVWANIHSPACSPHGRQFIDWSSAYRLFSHREPTPPSFLM